jgi:biopolymer transport protein TolR
MGMMNGSGGRRAVKSDLNITPMVDVVFVLLIIFMVAAPMIEQGVDLDLPQTETVPIESPKDKFIIRVFKGKKEANNQIFIDKTAVPIDELEEKLKTNERIKSEKEVFLHASKELSYGYVVRVMAIMKKAGVNSISLVTEPLEGEK